MLDRLKIETPIYGIGATIAVILGFLLSGIAERIEHWSTDLLISTLSDRRPSQYPDIALVVISSRTLEEFPYSLPPDRGLIAKLIERLDASDVKLIGLDILFTRRTELNKDAHLVETIRNAKSQVVLAALDTRTELVEPSRKFQDDFLRQSGRLIGHIYFDLNRSPLIPNDQTVRSIGEPSPDNPSQKSFAEVLAATAGHQVLPPSRYISWLLPPRNGTETFFTLSAEHVLGGTGAVELPLKELLRGRIVLVGTAFSSLDQHFTPLSVMSGERYNGLFIHAQILAQLLDRRFIHSLPWSIQILIWTCAGCCGIWFSRNDVFGHYQLWIRAAGVASFIVISAATFVACRVMFPITLTLMFLLAGFAFGRHSRRYTFYI